MPVPDSFDPPLRPPQFGLRTLLAGTTVCAILCALTQWLPPVMVAGAVFLVLSVGAHIAGNALGTRLRDHGNPHDPDWRDRWERRPRVAVDQFAPVTRLSQKQSLGWPLLVATIGGFVAGAIGGGWWTIVSATGPIAAESLAVGAVAFSILGGLWSFLAAGFVQVLGAAIRQAMRGSAATPTARLAPQEPGHDELQPDCQARPVA